MMRSRWCVMACALPLCGCEYPVPSTRCPADLSVAVVASPGNVQSDGTVTVYGSIQVTGPAGSGSAGSAGSERTVDALFVADIEVQLASDAFNFRNWTVTLTADRVAAFTTTMADGSKQGHLPVRAYIDDGCVMEMPQDQQPVLRIPKSGG
jgi:hypothetical protein